MVGTTLKPGVWMHAPELLDRVEAVARTYVPVHAWLRDQLRAGR